MEPKLYNPGHFLSLSKMWSLFEVFLRSYYIRILLAEMKNDWWVSSVVNFRLFDQGKDYPVINQEKRKNFSQCTLMEVPLKSVTYVWLSQWGEYLSKDHIFWEGRKILRNLYQLFDWQYIHCTVLHINRQVLFGAGNQGNHQNFEKILAIL